MDEVLDVLVPAPFGFVGISYAASGPHLAFMTYAQPLKPVADPRALELADWVHRYLNNPFVELPEITLQHGTAFQQRVWQAMRAIPPGCTLTYAALASQVQSGPRAVANACGANPLPLFNPCHRVLARHGLGGFMQGHPEGLAIKRWLLAHEQAQV